MRIDHVPVAAGRAVTLFALLICQAAAKAPIVFDGSLGKPGGALSGSDIPADRGVRNGGNLFHSFSRFNVGKGGTANFQTHADTTNILARVTGGEVRISLTDQPGQIANDGLFATGNFSAVARKISVSDSIVLFDGGSLDFRTSGPGELPLAPGPTPPPAASGGGAITFTNTVFESPGKSFHASAAGNLRADRSVIASADGFLPGAPEKIQLNAIRDLTLTSSSIQKPNFGTTNGGRIALAAGVILSNSSRVTASSTFGTDGIVRIDPQSVLSGAEDREDPQPLNATDVLQPECTDRLATEAGSFIRAGRGSTPRLPGGYLPSIRLHRLPE
jgi:hypothetical protein